MQFTQKQIATMTRLLAPATNGDETVPAVGYVGRGKEWLVWVGRKRVHRNASGDAIAVTLAKYSGLFRHNHRESCLQVAQWLASYYHAEFVGMFDPVTKFKRATVKPPTTHTTISMTLRESIKGLFDLMLADEDFQEQFPEYHKVMDLIKEGHGI